MEDDNKDKVINSLLDSILDSILVSSEDAIISTDTQGIITSWNTASEKRYGRSSGEMVGKSFALVIPEPKKEELLIMLDRIKKRKHYTAETLRVRKDGPVLDVSVVAAPIFDPERRDNVLGMSLIEKDITERRRAESKEKTYTVIEENAITTRKHALELQKAYESLKVRTRDLERFQRMTIGREKRMMELKAEVNALLKDLGRPTKYRAAKESTPEEPA